MRCNGHHLCVSAYISFANQAKQKCCGSFSLDKNNCIDYVSRIREPTNSSFGRDAYDTAAVVRNSFVEGAWFTWGSGPFDLKWFSVDLWTIHGPLRFCFVTWHGFHWLSNKSRRQELPNTNIVIRTPGKVRLPEGATVSMNCATARTNTHSAYNLCNFRP